MQRYPYSYSGGRRLSILPARAPAWRLRVTLFQADPLE